MNSFISSPKCPVERDDENSVISPEGHGSACNNKFSTIEKFNNLEEFSNVLIDEDCKFEKGRHTSGYFTSGSDYETVSSCIDGSSVNKYFKAHIKVRDERITLGPFFIEEEAAMAYDESVINRRTLSRKLKQETERRRHNLTRRAAKKETEKSILKEGVSSEQAAKRAFQAASNAYASVKVDNFTLRNLEIQKKRLNFFVNELEDEDKEYEQKYEQTRKKLKELDQALFSSEILKREEPYTNKKTITKSGKQLKSQIHKILEKYVGIDKETKSISDDPESELCQINRHLNDQLQIQVSQTLEKAESLARLAEIEKNFAPLFRQHDLSSRKINALHGSIFVEQHLQSPWGGEWL
uniref:Uncharacterized protein n=1 Tax=Corethron hystrix TaxID=216773 RepID=A0A7S1FY34_9STRA